MRLSTLALALTLALVAIADPRTAFSSNKESIAIGTLTDDANAIAIGTISAVVSELTTNGAGDTVIMSDVTVTVEESLKGSPGTSFVARMEGGVVNGVSYAVSDMDALPRVGRRAVWFLDATSMGKRPTSGTKVLELDRGDVVRGRRGLTLERVRDRIDAAL